MRHVLIMALALLPGALLRGAEGGARALVKANLDLPYDAGGSAEEAEESPEIIVFYGQQFEGQGVFFCCGTAGICRT